MARQAGEDGKVRPKKKKNSTTTLQERKKERTTVAITMTEKKKTKKNKTSAETLQQNRSRRGSKPCCFCYSPSSRSFREHPKNPIPSQKILKLDNPKALECQILAKLFAATVCAADGREIFGNRGELQHCPSVRVFLSLSLSLSCISSFFGFLNLGFYSNF
jgi:hypothetical protein